MAQNCHRRHQRVGRTPAGPKAREAGKLGWAGLAGWEAREEGRRGARGESESLDPAQVSATGTITAVIGQARGRDSTHAHWCLAWCAPIRRGRGTGHRERCCAELRSM